MSADLSRLNAQSFERLIRALALRLFGTEGTVYGAGPDAGRDFTIEGRIRGYEASGWNGYVVLQCKFRESGTGRKDAEWLIKALEPERLAFVNMASGRRRPDYYIVATNVSLSGSDSLTKSSKSKKGGHSKVVAWLDSWRADIGIQGFDLWPHAKVVDLLAQAPDVRRDFAAWVTPSDVLAAILNDWHSSRPQFEPSIRRALVNNIRQAQFTSLKDAGSVSDAKIRTGQVFIDIPYERSGVGNGPRQYVNPSDRARVARDIVARARDRFDVDSTKVRRAKGAPYRNRIVLLGGPGQGKSTVASYLAQLFRSTLVIGDPAVAGDDAVVSIVPEIIERARVEGISTNGPRRYPVLVHLPRFADAITSARTDGALPPSLLAFAASALSEACDDSIGKADLRKWLPIYPWVVILDGLDEVPPSGERGGVIDAISAFMTEINESGADVLTIVTTRPQGYNGDLDPSLWEHWELSDLTTERALAYANALGVARYPDDRTRRDDIHRKLVTASKETATARLMISPLQVTILYLIVDTGGSAPTARWTLFNEYYEVLRRREKAKGGALQVVLERNWSFLGPIHQRAGLILQALSETEGGAQASFDRAEFEQLVSRYLEDHGFNGKELESRASELAGVALNRLVLLSAREEGAIRFDVRSLQEFMAAAALTSGEIAEVEARLLHLAGISHWRHSLLIAASRYFAEDAFHHRRSVVTSLTRGLDASPSDEAVGNGARLALELFVDGIGADAPVFRRILAQHALDTISLGLDVRRSEAYRLWDPAVIDIVIDHLQGHLHSATGARREAAWRMLLSLSFQDEAAFQIVRAEWHENRESEILSYLEALDPPPPGPFRDWLAERFRKLTAPQALHLSERLEVHGRKRSWRRELFAGFDVAREHGLTVPLLGISHLTVGATSITESRYFGNLKELSRRFTRSVGWDAVCDFAIRPSNITLARALRAIADSGIEDMQYYRYQVPWPLAALIQDVSDEAGLRDFAILAEAGGFGSMPEWLRAEQRWMEKGITSDDLACASGSTRLHRDIAVVGAPTLLVMTIHHDAETTSVIPRLLDAVKDDAPLGQNRDIAEIISYLAFPTGHGNADFDPVKLLEVLAAYHPGEAELSILDSVWPPRTQTHDFAMALSTFGEAGPMDTGETLIVSPQQILQLYGCFPRARGLLYLVVLVAAAREDTTQLEFDGSIEGYLRAAITDPPHVAVSALCLRAAAHGVGAIDIVEFADRLHDLCSFSVPIFSSMLSGLVHSGLLSDATLTEVLMELLTKLGRGGSNIEAIARSHLKTVLDRRRSNLLSPKIWLERLKLPKDAIGSFGSTSLH